MQRKEKMTSIIHVFWAQPSVKNPFVARCIPGTSSCLREGVCASEKCQKRTLKKKKRHLQKLPIYIHGPRGGLKTPSFQD